MGQAKSILRGLGEAEWAQVIPDLPAYLQLQPDIEM